MKLHGEFIGTLRNDVLLAQLVMSQTYTEFCIWGAHILIKHRICVENVPEVEQTGIILSNLMDPRPYHDSTM